MKTNHSKSVRRLVLNHDFKNCIKINMSRKIMYFTALFTFTAFANAQVSLGGKQVVEGNNTILDFNSTVTGKKATNTAIDNKEGIILPAVATEPVINVPDPLVQHPNNGTFIYDRAAEKVKMFENNQWKDLSDAGDADKIIPNTSAESTNLHGAIIGANTSEATGVLILESADKALILPRIANPHTAVESPYPGMMCYDTVSKTLAVFDGSVWNYWK